MGTYCSKSLFHSDQSSTLFHFYFSFDLALEDEKQKYKYLNDMESCAIISLEDGFCERRGITQSFEENVFRNHGVCCCSVRKRQDVSCETIL